MAIWAINVDLRSGRVLQAHRRQRDAPSTLAMPQVRSHGATVAFGESPRRRPCHGLRRFDVAYFGTPQMPPSQDYVRLSPQASLCSLSRQANGKSADNHTRAVRTAIDQCTQHEAHFLRKDIFRETFVSAQGRGGVNPARLHLGLNHDLEKSHEFVNLGVRNKVQRYSIPEVLFIETTMLDHAQRLHNYKFTPLPDKIVHRVAAKERRVEPSRATSPVGKLYDALLGDKRTYSLDNEQQACVRYATQAPGRIKAIYGAAGTTKTSVVAAIAEAYQKAGWETYGTALSGVAAKNLADKTGVESDTVKMTLMRLYPTTANLARHYVKQVWRAARSMPTYKFDRLQLTMKSVLFVDEAPMIGTRDFALLTNACADSGAVMIAVGDAKQLPAIEHGGAFAAIVHRLGGFELTNIQRQERPEERDRVKQLSRGETEAVLKSYAQEGKLHVARTHQDAQEKLIQDWARSGGLTAPKDHAIFAATNLEVRSLNDIAQRQRADAGRLSCLHSLTVGEETFYGGDRVLFTKKSRKLAVENGDTGTIVGIRNNPLSAAVKVRFDGEDKVREIPLRTLLQTHYDGLTRGYAMTVHKMQGRTVDHAYCLLTGAMTDRELTYVALSRHRKTVQIYTDENHAGVALTNLARQATGEGQKITAKPGLNEEYSPLIKQASKSNAKTLASDQREPQKLTLTLRPEG